MHRYYIEIRLKEGANALDNYFDMLLIYGSRSSFVEKNDLRKNLRRAVLESCESLSIKALESIFPGVRVTHFEEESSERITTGLEVPPRNSELIKRLGLEGAV
jgi:hypothetical protein